MTETEDGAAAAREAYLENQRAVAASAKAKRGLSPFVIVSLIGSSSPSGSMSRLW